MMSPQNMGENRVYLKTVFTLF